MKGFVLDPLAEEDLTEAANYYESQVSGLGEDFLDEVFTLIDRLVSFPESGSRKTKIVRVARVRRFPTMSSIRLTRIWIGFSFWQ